MKKLFLLLLIFSPGLAIGQSKTPLDSLANTKLSELIETWTLGIDSATEVVDIKVYNKFKSLFELNATIEDDFNAVYRNVNERTGLYKIDKVVKSFDDYAHDVALQIRSIVFTNIATLDSSITDPNNMSYTIKRSVELQKTRKWVLPEDFAAEVIKNRGLKFENDGDSVKMVSNLNAETVKGQDSIYRFSFTDTVRIAMRLDVDTVRILSIKSFLSGVSCTNDADLDAVLDREDSVLNRFGDFTSSGAPDIDLDRVPDSTDKCPFTFGETTNQGCPASYFITRYELEAFVGLQYHSVNLNLPELNQLGYMESGQDAVDVLQSKKGSLKNPGRITGMYAGANFSFYFGQKRKQKGISVGFTYAALDAEYQLSEPVIYTYKSSDGLNFYRRQIQVDSLKESIHYVIYNFPVMFNYRAHLNKSYKSVINLKAGPSLMLFNNTSGYDALVDIAGLYQVDVNTKNKFAYYDYFDPGSIYNVLFTPASLNPTADNQARPGANAVFQQLNQRGYDFATKKSYSGKQDLKRLAVGFNADVDLQQKISEGLTIKVGAHFVYSPLLNKKEKYKPLDKTTDEFQSIYNSNAKSNYNAIGVNAGVVYNF